MSKYIREPKKIREGEGPKLDCRSQLKEKNKFAG
jgi:hypothetical protein